MDTSSFSKQAQDIADRAGALAAQLETVQTHAQVHSGMDPFIFGLTVFVLACFVGYYVVWKVTPALHTPLMSVTNAISGIIVVGAIIALGTEGAQLSHWAGFFAVMLASINIFGGFVVTQRMLAMFHKKPTKGD